MINTGKLDLIVSYNVRTGGITYHIISIDNGGGVDTTLNFNPSFLITGVDKIDNLLFSLLLYIFLSIRSNF